MYMDVLDAGSVAPRETTVNSFNTRREESISGTEGSHTGRSTEDLRLKPVPVRQ